MNQTPTPSKKKLQPLIENKFIFKTEENNNKKDLIYINISKEGIKERKKYSRYTKQKQIFNKLYGYSDEYFRGIRQLKREKTLSLSEHQDKLLQLSTNLRKENIVKLNKDLRNIRVESSLVEPLPPINFESLIRHSKNETKMNNQRLKISLRRSLASHQEKDDYELELEKMNKIKFNKNQKDRPNLIRMYEILPEHIVDAFKKKIK